MNTYEIELGGEKSGVGMRSSKLAHQIHICSAGDLYGVLIADAGGVTHERIVWAYAHGHWISVIQVSK